MANYYQNDDGTITKKRKNKKGKNYIQQDDGSIILNPQDRSEDIAPVRKDISSSKKSSALIPLLDESTKKLTLSNLALRTGDVDGINSLRKNLEENQKLKKEYNELKDKEESELISKTSKNDLANIDRYNKGANVSDNNLGKVFEYADSIKNLRKSGYTLDELKEIAPARKRQTNAAEMEKKKEESAKYAKEHKVLGSLMSVPQNLVSGVTGTADAVSQFLIDPYRKLDINTGAFSGMQRAAAAREAISEDMSPLAGFIYQTSMSLADSMAAIGTAGGTGLGSLGSLGLMASESATNTIIDATNRGMTADKALTAGMAAGFFEGFFERVSLGNLIKLSKTNPKGLKQIVTNISESMFVNASEEAATEFANIMFDNINGGSLSNAKLMYDNYVKQGIDKDKAQKLVIKDLAMQVGEAGLGGALMGGGFGIAGTVAGKINNRPNDNDNKVIEKETQERAKDKRKTVAIENEVNKRISESEEVNGVLSDTEKNNIRKAVEADVESGKFDVTATELSSKDFDEIRKQVRNDLENGKISLKRVEETLFPEKAQRFSELVEELKTADEDQRESIENELKTISNDISKIIGSSKHLSKSYEQEMLKNTAFKKETNTDDTDLTKLLDKSAARAGLNDTPEAHDTYNLLNKVANDSGTEYVFTSNKELEALGYNLKGRTVNGLVRTTNDGKTRVLVNIDSNNALNIIIGHETTHLLKNTDSYEQLKKLVIDYAQEKGEYGSRLEELTELYKDTNANIEEELVADLIGEYVFTDEAFVKNLSAKQPNIFQKIYSHIKHLIKMATAGSKEAKQLEQIKNTFDKAYKEMGKASEVDSVMTTDANSNTKYALGYTKDNKAVAIIENDILKDVPEGDWVKIVKNEIKKFRPGIPVSGRFINISRKSASHFVGSDDTDKVRNNNPSLYKDKLNVSQNIDDVIYASTDYVNEDPKHKRTDDIEQFARGNVYLRIGEKDYKASVIIGYTNKNEMLLYDVQDLEPAIFEIKEKRYSQHWPENSETRTTTVSLNDSIRKNNKNSNTKYSLSDNQGRELTKEQQEYFKDSKVRDENGSLMVMYHGTPNGDFTTFKSGSYFTPKKEYADVYQAQGASSLGYKKTANKPNTYEVYLNIKKPFDTRNPKERKIFEEEYYGQWGMGTPLMDSGLPDWMDGEDLQEFLEENGYDYDGLILDEGGVGGYGDEVVSRGLSYVVFNPEQVKKVDNTKPTSDPDIRFSLSAPVAEGKTLMAIRNIREKELRGMISLGGIPVPSIAITDPSKVNHTDFGPISILFDKETINPANKKNEVYDRDIWSSRFPTIEYEIDYDKASDLYSRAREAGPVPMFNPVTFEPHNLEDTLNRRNGIEGLVEYFKDDLGVKNLFLAETSSPVSMKKREKITEISQGEAELYDIILERMGDKISQIKTISGREWNKQYGEEFKAVQKEAWKQLLPTLTDEDLVTLVDEKIPPKQVILAKKIQEYSQDGGKKVEIVEDLEGTKKEIDSRINAREYEKWLRGLFKDLEKTKGIYNGNDPYTPSGNRRSFKQLHDPYNLENLVKNMTKGRTQGSEDAMFGVSAGAISANMATRFNSIEDIKANEGKIDPEADMKVKALKDELSDSITALSKYYKGDSWNASDSLRGAVFEFSTKKLTENNLRNILKDYNVNAESIPTTELQRVITNLNNLKDIPSDYFEAKPQRAVGLEEIRAIVLPNDIDIELKQELSDKGFYVIEYDPNIEGDRQNKINQFDDLKFSLSNSNQDIAPTKDYRIYGEDIKLKDNIAPVNINKSETISQKETVQNIAPVNPNIAKAEPTPAEAEPRKPQSSDKPVRPLLRTEMKSISRSIKRSYGSTFDPTKDIMRLYNAMHSGKLTDEEAAMRATEIGRDIVDNIKTKQVRTVEAQEVLDMLRNSRIKLDVEQISEVSKMYDGYNNYKQSMFGKVIISKNGIDLDTKWQELSEEYPHIFDPDVNPLEQPQELANIIRDMQNSYEQQGIPDATEIGVEIYQKYFEVPERRKTHGEIQREKVEVMKEQLAAKGFDLDKILEDAKDKSTFSSVDNTPQRFTEKTFGFKEGQAINEFLGNKVALDEAEGVKWLNSITGKKDGLLAQLSREYNIKPGTKESAAAQMYGEGFFVDEFGDYRRYGDEELAQDFPDFETQNNIKGLANDPRIREFYNKTFDAINESRTRNGYDAIPKRENYFLHFFEMNDFFTLHGIPFNPNDIRKKDLPTELNGMTADLKPGQPYFASANRRMGVNTTYDLLRGIEQYAVSAEPQIYHIDNIQLYRGFRNYIADMYGKTKGLENLGALSEDEQQNRIEKVFDSHLSVYAKHLNEQANILAGKTALIDRGLEGILGRRGITTLNEINRQVGSNMVGFNISSAFTNYLAMVQAMAKLPLNSSIKGFTGLISNKIRSLNGYSDGFVESDPAMIRRKGADQFYRKNWQKVADLGYKLMSATDDMVTEFIVRAKYDELINKGMEDKEAHIKAGEWAMRLLGDRSKGQMPQIFNSKTLGLFTKFQLEVRNQLDSMFYDTNNEAKVSTETIKNEKKKNIAKAAKITSTVAQLVIYQHIFGKAFESIAGYNPAFDILGVLITALGFDDDEDSEDTVLDNVEQGFLDLLEDMPYSSVLTGGRIPISQALPIKEVISGKDSYGNDKSRIKTITEAAPFYFLPTGYGQIKKTAKGLAMFDKDNPVSGSYTDSGNLRFPVEDTVLNRIQAGLFGQYANANARKYFDNERAPLKSKQIQEYKELNIPIADYWKYRDGLKNQKTLEEKFDYIANLDIPVSKKNIMINNVVDRDEKVDLINYDDFESYEEFDFATKHPEKYSFLESIGATYKDYSASEESKEAYNWAYNNRDKYSLVKAVYGDVVKYRDYAASLNNIKADKDSNGKTISGSRKLKVAEYLSSLDADYGAKLILFKSEYKSDDRYNNDIIDYLNNRQDISYDEMVEILKELGFIVDSQGNVRW